jgi:hypothetical protein
MRITIAVAALVLGGCAGNPAPVTVAGTPRDLAALAGEWNGEYNSAQTGRSGSIAFRLRAGTDSAWGDVVMVPAGAREPMQPHRDHEGRDATTATQVLTIRFVQIVGGTVNGVLDPYQDPECGCAVYTTFVGRVRGDRVEGEFVSRHSGHGGTFGGRWSAQRRGR